MDEVLLVETAESTFSGHAHRKAPRRAGPLSIPSRSSDGDHRLQKLGFSFGLGYHVVVSRAASGSSRQRLPSMAIELICSESIRCILCGTLFPSPITSSNRQAFGFDGATFAFPREVTLCPELGHARTEIPPLMTSSAGGWGPLSSAKIWRKVLFRQAETNRHFRVPGRLTFGAVGRRTKQYAAVSAIRFFCATIATRKILREPR
jgi:hypothetical protein